MKTLRSLKDIKVLGIDPATHSLAWALCVANRQGDVEVLDYGKIELVKQKGMEAQIAMMTITASTQVRMSTATAKTTTATAWSTRTTP